MMEIQKGKIDIMICTKDRPCELALLLQSLRTQTYQNFDIYIVDDVSGTLLSTYHFLTCIVNRMKLENHKVKIVRNEFNLGVSKCRQRAVDLVMKEGNGEFLCRLDDDVIVEPDYLFYMIDGLNKHGYDLMSGITTPIMQPILKRNTKFVKPIINEVILDKEGNIIKNGDDCGFGYIQDEIIPTHHFRSSAVYRRKIHEAGVNYDNRLSKHGFREEQIFSFKCIIAGFKLGVQTWSNTMHLLTPSGGERPTTSLAPFNEKIFRETTKKMFKEHGDFIKAYNKKYKLKGGKIDKDELKKSTNLV